MAAVSGDSPQAPATAPGPVAAAARPVALYWDTYCSCTGINIEAANLLLPLDAAAHHYDPPRPQPLPQLAGGEADAAAQERVAASAATAAAVSDVRAVCDENCWCPGFPASDARRLANMTYRYRHAVLADIKGRADGAVRMWVSHKPADAFPSFPYRVTVNFLPGHLSAGDEQALSALPAAHRLPNGGYALENVFQRPQVLVGRTMLELDRVPMQWVGAMADMDEVWVPAPFLADVLCRSGVQQPLIFVVPESLDTTLFSPYSFERREGSHQITGSRSPVVHVEGSDHPNENFHFFSNFKWEARKGWEALLEAYFRSFTAADRVTLYLKTYLYLDPDAHNPRRIRAVIDRFAETLRGMPLLADTPLGTWAREADEPITPDQFTTYFSKNRDAANVPAVRVVDTAALPTVVILTDEVRMEEMPSLYAQMDAFVLPTRGEGWGLPLMEAMAMGLPTVATAWGGSTAFMQEHNSLLVANEGMTDGTLNTALHHPQRGRAHEWQGHYPRHSHRTPQEHLHPIEGAMFSADALMSGQAADCASANLGVGGPSPRAGRWASPSVEHVAAHMLWLAAHPSAAKAIGQAARRHIVDHFSRAAVAAATSARIADAVARHVK